MNLALAGVIAALVAVLGACPAGAGSERGLLAGAAADEIAIPFGPRPIWLAGRGTHRPATWQHDPLTAQALVLDDGTTRLGIVSVDAIGLHDPLVDGVRERLRAEGTVDHLVVIATHTHSAPDTIGAWGPDGKTTGLDPAFLAEIADSIVASVREARRAVAPAHLSVARERTGTAGWQHRTREPRIVDDALAALFVERRDDGGRIATLVNYAAHPESLAPPHEENALVRHAVSADYVHALRTHVPGDAPVLFANGAVGAVNPAFDSGLPDGAARAERFGRRLAERVRALERAREPVGAEAIDVRTKRLRLPVDNARFLLGYCAGIFGDRVFHRGPDAATLPRAEACDLPAGVELTTEVSLVDLGHVRMLALPGEIFPELVVGYGPDRVAQAAGLPEDEACPAPGPAPDGPFLRERFEREGRILLVLGLANDEIGYVVPARDFVVDEERPYLERPNCGGHYHETNSLGPRTAELLLEAIDELRER